MTVLSHVAVMADFPPEAVAHQAPMSDIDAVQVEAGPVALVGRDRELHLVETAVAGLAEGRGGTLAFLGPAGIGKSRLAREAVRAAIDLGATVLAGRAVAGRASMPYRPLVEALAPWARTHRQSEVTLGAHARALDVLVPGWSSHPADPLSPVFVAEALLQLLPQVTRGAPALLLIEDLHWADEETLAAIEYLSDAAESLQLLLITTCRDEESVAPRRLLRALGARGVAQLVQLGALGPNATAQLAASRLGRAAAPALTRLLVERADGLPLFIEELLAALAAGGGLELSTSGVDVTADAAAVLPATVSDTVAARLDTVPDEHRRVLEQAALLGRSFDHELLAAAAGEPVTPALREAADLGILHEDPERPGQLRFRHVLLRDGVLAATFPPRRAELARELLDVLLPRELGGDELSIGVELAARAGDSALAARLALRRAMEALDRWALASAEQGLAEARQYAGADRDLLIEIDVAQIRVASIVGRIPVVMRVGGALLTRLETDGRHDAELLETHLRLAQAELDEGHGTEAEEHLAAAAPLVPDGEACTHTRFELESALAAELRGDDELARKLAVQAAQLARPYDDQPDLVCASLLCEGRNWLPDVEMATARWAEALQYADTFGLRLWRGRMLTELASVAVDDLEGVDKLREAAELAREAGGISTLVRIALLEARVALLRGALDDAEAALSDAEDMGVASVNSRRAAADLRAGLDVLRGRALDQAPDPAAGPSVRVLASLCADDVADARAAAGAATCDTGTLRLIADLIADSPRPGAVARARAALPDLPRAVAELESAPLLAALFTVVWAPSSTSVREPLHAAVAIFDGLGLTKPAEACRATLREHGIPLPRRVTAQAGVPDHLRAAGVTIRELDVLRLLAEGQSNRDVAAALYLSPRTVEKHVERLLIKTGAANRTALAALARSS
jgi:DNA-binding CsgD family transcriptional regulator